LPYFSKKTLRVRGDPIEFSSYNPLNNGVAPLLARHVAEKCRPSRVIALTGWLTSHSARLVMRVFSAAAAKPACGHRVNWLLFSPCLGLVPYQLAIDAPISLHHPCTAIPGEYREILVDVVAHVVDALLPPARHVVVVLPERLHSIVEEAVGKARPLALDRWVRATKLVYHRRIPREEARRVAIELTDALVGSEPWI
jgi:hypothetical protein